MRPEPPERVSADEVWSQLRRHLDWARNQGTLVMIAVTARDEADDLRQRTQLWTQREGQLWAQTPDVEPRRWLSEHFPVPGVVWVELWERGARLEALHALNELRVRLTSPDAGCLVLCGPLGLLEETAREAVDLWSVRSLTYVVGSRADLHPVVEPSEPAAPAAPEGPYRSTWRLTLPPEMRTAETAALLRDVEQARRLLRSDPVAARHRLEASPYGASPLGRVMFGLVRAEIAGHTGDLVSVDTILPGVLTDARGLPLFLRQQLADAAWTISTQFDAWDAASTAAAEQLALAREMPQDLDGLDARAVALTRFGTAARMLGDWATATTAVQEATSLYRNLTEQSPAFTSKLAGALNTLAFLFAKNGRLDEALTTGQEATRLYRNLAAQNPAAHAPDLAMSLNNLATLLAETGHPDEALTTAHEATTLYRNLVSQNPAAHTPDLAGSLNNLANLLAETGHPDEALTTAHEATTLYRNLVKQNPAAHAPDLAMALNNLANWLAQTGHRDQALTTAQKALRITRDLATTQENAQALRALSVSLRQVARFSEQAGETARAEELRRECAAVMRTLKSKARSDSQSL